MIYDKSVIICGAGTLGGNLAENLARIGFTNLTVIDFDRVEARNLKNQPYFFFDVGQFKVKALSEFLFRAAGARMNGINKKLTSGNGEKLLRGASLVIDTFDNSESRKAVKEICLKNKIPCLHVGMSADGYGEIIWNEAYRVPPDLGADACESLQNRNMSILTISIATQTMIAFLESGIKKSYTVTLNDLKIVEFISN